MPVPLQGMIWQALSTPLGAPYMPFFNTLHVLPAEYTQGSNSRGEAEKASLTRFWHDHENRAVAEQAYIKRMLTDMYRDEPFGAVDFTRRYSTGIAYECLGLANERRDGLMTEMATGA